MKYTFGVKNNSEFYIQHNFLPTETELRFENVDELKKYNLGRSYLLENCLQIPTKLLNESSLLEIGPDSGENAYSAASMGANVTCIDANPKSIQHLKKLFSKSRYENNLSKTYVGDYLDTYVEGKFSFVFVEGFLHSVLNKEKFVRKIESNMQIQGFFITSYYDQFSIFGDLLHSSIFRTLMKSDLGLESPYDNLEVAVDYGEDIFLKKWQTKKHLRSLRTWILDVLLNPTMSFDRTIDTEWLLRLGNSIGLHLWQSWPNLKRFNNYEWHRDMKSPDELLEVSIQHYHDRVLENFFGILLPEPLEKTRSRSRNHDLSSKLLEINKSLSEQNWSKVSSNVKSLISDLIAEESKTPTQIFSALKMTLAFAELFLIDDFVEIRQILSGQSEKFSSESIFFLGYWGHPNHYSSYRKCW